MDISTIQETVIREFSLSPNGCQCKFIKLDNKWGLKLFTSPRKRDEVCENQKKCHKVGYAPEVGECVDLPSGPIRFGYITEIAEIIFDEKDYQGDDTDWTEVDDWYSENYDELKQTKKEIEKLTGWNFVDDHAFNWGILNGKIIPIDFGVLDAWGDRANFEEIEQELLALCEDI
jgi:hypothetical protein